MMPLPAKQLPPTPQDHPSLGQPLPDETTIRTRRAYFAACNFVDDQVGKLVKPPKNYKLDTAPVIMSTLTHIVQGRHRHDLGYAIGKRCVPVNEQRGMRQVDILSQLHEYTGARYLFNAEFRHRVRVLPVFTTVRCTFNVHQLLSHDSWELSSKLLRISANMIILINRRSGRPG